MNKSPFKDAVHPEPRRASDPSLPSLPRRELDDDEIFSVVAAVRTVLETEHADEKDRAIFTLYERCAKFRRTLEQIASFPRLGRPEEEAAKALDWPGVRVGGKFRVPNKEIEAAVNKGLAITHFNGLQDGARVMYQEGVPLDVGLRVLLHPEARRTTDWREAAHDFSGSSYESPHNSDRRDH